MTSCALSIAKGEYTSLVSVDIQGAFDNVEWRDILLQLQKINCPSNIAGVIRSYLSERSVLINWGAGYSMHPLEKGCPQGSCLGPILWLLIANIILIEMHRLGYTLYAFADDFSLILSGRVRSALEKVAAEALPIFCQLLESLHLKLSPQKSQALTFNKPRPLDPSRPPKIHVNGKSVHHVPHLKLLGITIDKHLNWIPHINNLRLKLIAFHHNSLKLTSKTWGVSNKLLKIWYTTIIEKIITYGASIWGGTLTKQAQIKLMSIQRIFTLQISRGYRTISTDALNVITGIPPITLTLKYEYIKGQILHLKNEQKLTEHFPNTIIQHKVHSWQLHPSEETSHIQVNTELNTYKNTSNITVFTDGSRTCTGVAAAYCVTEGGVVTHRWACRLGDNNSVFQAELYAILRALDWVSQIEVQHVPIYSDSLSGLQAIYAHRTTNPLVLQIKQKLKKLLRKIKLGYVSAQKGTYGNEQADAFAKQATKNTEVDYSLPLPPSYIKRKLKSNILPDWQDYWDTSIKGRHTHALIPKVSHHLYTLQPHTTSFLTGHGPFKAYLHKFNCARTNKCDCGEIGTAEHAYHICPLTHLWHIKRPAIPPKGWLLNILTRPTLLTKLKHIHNYLAYISNLTD